MPNEHTARAANWRGLEPATAEDVGTIYRLVLGREAETDQVVADRVGAPLGNLLAEFALSEECANWIGTARLDHSRTPGMLARPPSSTLLAWTKAHIAPPELSGGGGTDVLTADLLVLLLSHTAVMDRLANAIGQAKAALLVAELARIADGIRVAPPSRIDLPAAGLADEVAESIQDAEDGEGYASWIALFDRLTDDHRAWLEADGAVAALPNPVHVHITRHADAKTTEQIGTSPTHQLIGRPGDPDPAEVIAAIPNGTVLIVSSMHATLRQHACYCFVRALAEGADAAYSDHDYRDGARRRLRPVFKPEMSPDLMASHPYAGPCVALRLRVDNLAAVARALSLACSEPTASAFAGLLAAASADRITRVPLILFSVAVASSTQAENGPIRPASFELSFADRPREPVIAPADLVRTNIIIPTRDRATILRACVESLLTRTDYPEELVRIVIVDNGSAEPDCLSYLADLAARQDCRIVRAPGPFNFSRLCNAGAAVADGELLVFLNNDTSVIEPGWLKMLVAQARRPGVGVVGAKLLFPDDTVQHGGMVLGVRGLALHRLLGVPAAAVADRDALREMAAVTGACMAVRRAVFDQIGGFDVALSVTFNDVDLCLRARAAGYRNLYVPTALFQHHEARTRGYDDTIVKRIETMREAIRVRSRYPDAFRNDPSYNPNLSFWNVGELARPPRVVPAWRRSPDGRRLLLLGPAHGVGAVARMVMDHAKLFAGAGWDVTIGSPEPSGGEGPAAFAVEIVNNPETAATFSVSSGIDCIIVHQASFLAVAHLLGTYPLFYLVDHGRLNGWTLADDEHEPDRMLAACLACRVLVTSETDAGEATHDEAILPNVPAAGFKINSGRIRADDPCLAQIFAADVSHARGAGWL